jgi:tetratricopeptide (TPR) repeat protein
VLFSFYLTQAQTSEKAQALNEKAYSFYLEGKNKEAGEKYEDADSAARTWVMFPVDSILAMNKDSVLVRIKGGINHGIIKDENGNVYSSYDSEEPDRGNLVLGSASCLAQTDNYSFCLVLLNDTTNPSLNIRINDILELPCQLPARDNSYVFTRLAKLDIQFNDLDVLPLYNQLQMLYNGDRQLEEEILALMVQDIYDTWDYIRDFAADNPSWSEPMDGGKYQGYSMLDAMKMTTKSDITAFLNFVASFPGKYMGKEWKINETYATWLINFTPLGEFDENMYRKVRELEGQDFVDYISQNVFYIQDSTLDKYNQDVEAYLTGGDPDNAEKLNEKLLTISTILGNETYRALFLTNKGRIEILRQNWKASIGIFDQVLLIDTASLNALFFRGYAYSMMHDYYHALQDYDKITVNWPDVAIGHGNKGWYLLLEGKIFQARKSCERAYELDSTTMSNAINLGHSYMLLGDTATAKRYYGKTLELQTSRQEFLTGIADFDIFLKNGWQTDYTTACKDFMLKRYNEDYQYYLLADSLYNLAIEQKDAEDYPAAAANMLASYEEDKKSKNPRDYTMYLERAWTGYIYYMMEDYDDAEKYYNEALYFTYDTFDDDTKTANMYLLMADNYDKWNKKSELYTSRQKADIFQQQADESGKTRRLFVLAAGNNTYKDLEYSYADLDAQSVASYFAANPSKTFDSVITQVIPSKDFNLENLEKGFKQVILDSRPDDIFLFYMGGVGSVDSARFQLTVRSNSSDTSMTVLGLNTIKTWVSSVQARNQLLVLDIFAPTFCDEFVANYALSRGTPASSSLNLSIIALDGHRMEEDSLQHGLLSYALLKIFEEQAFPEISGNNMLTAKEMDALLVNMNVRFDGLLAWNAYHTGNDFTLVNNRTAEHLRQASVPAPSGNRGVGSLNPESDERPDLSAEGTNYALLFATDDYEEWSDLVNPINDANALAGTLRDYYGFQVEVLTNNSRIDVLTKIREYQKRQYSPNDQLFIFFAGHGSYDDISGEGYIVCKDSKKDDEIRASYISYSYLRENVNNIRTCDHVLIALDVCFGGTFDKQVSKFGRGEEDYNQISKDAFLARSRQYKTRLFITSGSKEYVPDGAPGKHSPFAYRILDVLRAQGMMNGYVTFNLLVQSVERLQTTPRYGDFGDNEPGSEFIFSIKSDDSQRAFKVVDLKSKP